MMALMFMHELMNLETQSNTSRSTITGLVRASTTADLIAPAAFAMAHWQVYSRTGKILAHSSCEFGTSQETTMQAVFQYPINRVRASPPVTATQRIPPLRNASAREPARHVTGRARLAAGGPSGLAATAGCAPLERDSMHVNCHYTTFARGVVLSAPPHPRWIE